MVCITTVGRLGMLVDAMKACAVATPPAATLIELIVVDNDIAGTARSTVEKFAANNPLPVTYAIEPRRGLAEARNRGIQLGLERGARWLAFIDDDSQPHPDWLDRLVSALRSESAKLVGGSNIFEAPKAPMTAWQKFVCQGLVDGSYRRYRRQRDRVARDKVTIVTGNWCADLHWIKDKALRFDQRYSATGGEDTAFDRSMRATGAKVLFVPDSIVVETVPVARISLRYQFKRLMMSSITKYNHYRRARGPAFALARALPQGILALLAGPPLFIVSAILAIVSPRPGALFLVRTSRLVGKSIGALGGAIGLKSELYNANHGYADEADQAANRRNAW
ncbi:glycosyltransferase [Bradyrhizobium sp. AUGA SZCCT0283]|uniref:glycosyltransferase family 2 protein n=1 Tax=Bradyrhizobium sp. AUGA SZCCT0283 TaxID=2807671 RepID=UPI0028A155B2|nr:glycosyltransferase [Bradyrhizobium sp. AUGA SZCCT0283]